MAKGAIKAGNTGNKAFLYTPLVSEEEFKADVSKSFLKKVFNGSLNLMVASFIKEQKMTKEEIDSLRKLLDEEG